MGLDPSSNRKRDPIESEIVQETEVTCIPAHILHDIGCRTHLKWRAERCRYFAHCKHVGTARRRQRLTVS